MSIQNHSKPTYYLQIPQKFQQLNASRTAIDQFCLSEDRSRITQVAMRTCHVGGILSTLLNDVLAKMFILQ